MPEKLPVGRGMGWDVKLGGKIVQYEGRGSDTRGGGGGGGMRKEI